MYFNYLENTDPEISAAIRREMNRQENKIEMIASENFVSRAVMEAVGSALTTNMRKDIRERDITADVSLSMKWRRWRSSV